jgi:phage gp37-like protein
LQLILDVRTRWNSMFEMLKRFIRVRRAIDAVNPNALSESEWQAITNVKECLEPVVICSTKLCSKSCTMPQSFAAKEFMMEVLQERRANGNYFAQRLIEALDLRIDERTNRDLKDALSICTGADVDDRRATIIFMAALHDRLMAPPIEEIDTPPTDDGRMTTETESTELTLEERFAARMTQSTTQQRHHPIESTTNSTSKILKKELNLFSETQHRPNMLAALYDCMLTVKPTSVESERAFSTATLFVTKIRSRMGDETLSNLAMLRAYFSSADLKK